MLFGPTADGVGLHVLGLELRYYLTGHRTFSNRGCEAIVRSTVAALRQIDSAVTVLVPSDNTAADMRQWPEAEEQGVQFVTAYFPRHARYWANLQRIRVPVLKRMGWPFGFPSWMKEQICSVDAVISVGGDNYSLDYRVPGLLMGLDRLAMDLGKPVVLWGASVGPFEREPHFVAPIRQHLGRMERILVRESMSYEYLTKTLGLRNVSHMADPAFMLRPEPLERLDFWPEPAQEGVIGVNVSPVIERYRANGQSVCGEVVGFVRMAVNRGFSVLLVPHVIPHNGALQNNDANYLSRIFDECVDLGDSVAMMPPTLNAAQIKYVISKLRFFIGARTHATIAALSSCIPTISIAYSIKARGINIDVFGDESLVIAAQVLNRESLVSMLNNLLARESQLKEALRSVMPRYADRLITALQSVSSLHE